MRSRFVQSIVMGAALAAIAACSDATNPAVPDLSSTLSFDSLRQSLADLPADSVARLRIHLAADTALAVAGHLGAPGGVNAREHVFGHVTAVDAAEDTARLTVAPGFVILVSRATSFSDLPGTPDTAAFDRFVARLSAALDSTPPVLLGIDVRRTPSEPRVLGPDDTLPADAVHVAGWTHHGSWEHDSEGDGANSDHAARLRGPDLSLNVTAANLLAPGDGDCDASFLGCVRLLGVTIGVDSATELRIGAGDEADDDHEHDGSGQNRFAGMLDCASLVTTDPTTGTFALVGHEGTIAMDSTTTIDQDEESLADLDAVAGACAASDTVRVEGHGTPSPSDSTVLVAAEVEFRLGGHGDGEGDHHGGHDGHGQADFAGVIDSIAGDTLFIGERVVLTDSETEIHGGGEGDHLTVADLSVGLAVEVEGTVLEDGSVLAEEIRIRSG